MLLKKLINLMAKVVFFFCMAAFSWWWPWTPRPYKEGTAAEPITGYAISLISARVDYTEDTPTLPEFCRIKFYLNQDIPAYVTVGELDDRYHYFLRDVTPPNTWKSGFNNTFEWSTKDVIKGLNLKMYDLGVVVRLGNPNPGIIEEVAPVIFYHSQIPKTITGYLFTFKMNGDSIITYSIRKEGENSPVCQSASPVEHPGSRPLTIECDTMAAEGRYELVLDAVFVSSEKVSQTIRFYHKPVVE